MIEIKEIEKLTKKLYACRYMAKLIHQEQYQQVIDPYIAILKSVMLHDSLDVFPALNAIRRTPFYNDKSGPLFLVAAVEIIETSNNKS